jgi:hypothetical protein
VDPNGICDVGANQNQTTALSACFEGTGFSTVDAAIDPLGKAGMALAGTVASPAIAWRIPTFYDYEIADYQGIRFVLPDIGVNGVGEEWTGTVSSINSALAWTYSSTLGNHMQRARSGNYSVRCVGR